MKFGFVFCFFVVDKIDTEQWCDISCGCVKRFIECIYEIR